MLEFHSYAATQALTTTKRQQYVSGTSGSGTSPSPLRPVVLGKKREGGGGGGAHQLQPSLQESNPRV